MCGKTKGIYTEQKRSVEQEKMKLISRVGAAERNQTPRVLRMNGRRVAKA